MAAHYDLSIFYAVTLSLTVEEQVRRVALDGKTTLIFRRCVQDQGSDAILFECRCIQKFTVRDGGGRGFLYWEPKWL
jgi:hypothetical protein